MSLMYSPVESGHDLREHVRVSFYVGDADVLDLLISDQLLTDFAIQFNTRLRPIHRQELTGINKQPIARLHNMEPRCAEEDSTNRFNI